MNKYLPLVVIAIIAVAIGVGVALAGKDDNQSTSTTSSSSNTTGQDNTAQDTNTTQNPSVTDEVEIEDMAFRPASITVKKGTKVTWTNKDSVAHTVTADSGTGPSSSLLSKGGTYSYTFNETGEFSYHCQSHPEMTGKVTVTE